MCAIRTLLVKREIVFVLLSILFYFFYEDISRTELSTKQVFTSDFYTSVWCRGFNHTDRQCRFRNLCYLPKSKEFVFFHHPESILSGVPNERFPVLLDMSSVDDHNTQYFTYVDLPFSSFKNFNVSYVNDNTLIFNRFNPDNLMHTFHDDLLPVFATLYEICDNSPDIEMCAITLFFAENRPPGPYYDLYKVFSSELLFVAQMDKNNLYCFKQSWLGLNKQTTWYEYGFKAPQGPLDQKDSTMTSRLIKKFKKMFLKRFDKIESAKIRDKYAVLISRKTNRLILNENDVINAIKTQTGLEVITVTLEEYSVLEIIRIIKNSFLVIGMHGALLVLTIFLLPGSVVIELFPYAVNPVHYTPYKTLVSLPEMGITYFSWQNIEIEHTVFHPENSPHLGGINHLSKEEQEKILSSKEVPLHLCCYNSEWLFRIYQDTLVNITSLKKILQNVPDLKIEHSTINNSDNGYKEIKNLLYPGQAFHPRCNTVSVAKNKEGIKISWDQPWNLLHILSREIEYEVWILLSETDNVTAVILKENSYIFTETVPNAEYLVWIRCHADGRIGPFNMYPLYCYT